jgi:hypothetical protein
VDTTSAPRVNVAELNDRAVTTLYDEARAHAAQLLRQRVVTRLATALLLDIKADGPPPLPSTEHQARELLGTLGHQLNEASQALFAAAERLKQRGDAAGASRTHEAAQQTKAAAQGVR